MRKMYNKCFVFCGVFHENIHEIPAKCEIRKVYIAGLKKGDNKTGGKDKGCTKKDGKETNGSQME